MIILSILINCLVNDVLILIGKRNYPLIIHGRRKLTGMRPSGPSFSFPSLNSRNALFLVSDSPYTTEPSIYDVSLLTCCLGVSVTRPVHLKQNMIFSLGVLFLEFLGLKEGLKKVFAPRYLQQSLTCVRLSVCFKMPYQLDFQ